MKSSPPKRNGVVDALDELLKQLRVQGAASADVINRDTHDDDIDNLNKLENVSLPDELLCYFKYFDGYDSDLCFDMDYMDPEFAHGMYCIPLDQMDFTYSLIDDCGDESYWPHGFLPILQNFGGDFIVVNCIKDSPTYGAVYVMTRAVGCNRLSDSVTDFLYACAKEYELGIRVFDDKELSEVAPNYLDKAKAVFGSTPFFKRKGRIGMDKQIIDWITD